MTSRLAGRHGAARQPHRPEEAPIDPDAALDELLDLTDQTIQLTDHGVRPPDEDVARLAELVDALDSWLMTGGFMPRRWAAVARRS